MDATRKLYINTFILCRHRGLRTLELESVLFRTKQFRFDYNKLYDDALELTDAIEKCVITYDAEPNSSGTQDPNSHKAALKRKTRAEESNLNLKRAKADLIEANVKKTDSEEPKQTEQPDSPYITITAQQSLSELGAAGGSTDPIDSKCTISEFLEQMNGAEESWIEECENIDTDAEYLHSTEPWCHAPKVVIIYAN